MMAKMFEGERTVKQLKKKYMKEMKENPKCVNRALSVPIDQGAQRVHVLYCICCIHADIHA